MTNKTLPTLYHRQNTCSQVVLIGAAEGGVDLHVEPVDLREKTLSDGRSYFDINPLGQVACLHLLDGTLLTENTAILMWMQAQSDNPNFRYRPENMDYYQVMRWVSFVATEIHKGIYRIVFYDEATDDSKDRFRETGMKRLGVLNGHLANREFLIGDHFSVADAYLTWALNLAPRSGIHIDNLAHLCRYRDQMLARPLVAKVIAGDQI